MNQWMHWWAMGVYYAYIWPAYGLSFLILAATGLGITRQRRRTRKILQQWYKRQER